MPPFFMKTEMADPLEESQKQLLAEINRILFDHDPVSLIIDPVSQADEYKHEARLILEECSNGNSVDELRLLIAKIFSATCGSLQAGSRFRYTTIAKEIMHAKNTVT